MGSYGRGGFGGGFGGGNQMQQLMKQAQKMQEEIQQAKEEIESTEIEGTAGGGAVKVSMYGNKVIFGVSINPEVVDPDDVEMLEDLLVAAINNGYDQADELSEEKLGKYNGLGGLL